MKEKRYMTSLAWQPQPKGSNACWNCAHWTGKRELEATGMELCDEVFGQFMGRAWCMLWKRWENINPYQGA